MVPGFSMNANEQREMSLRMKNLLDIFKNESHGSVDTNSSSNAIFNVVFNRVETSVNMQTCFYKMSQLASEPRLLQFN